MGCGNRFIKGGHVRFTDANGYPHERETARAVFNTIDVYIIAKAISSMSGAWLEIEGAVGEHNSVMFESAE